MSSRPEWRRPTMIAAVLGCGACYHGLDDDGRFASQGGDATTDDDGASDDGGPNGVPDDGDLPTLSMSRLTRSRLRHAVGDLFSPALAAALVLPDDLSVQGWVAIASRELTPSRGDVAAYEAAAREIAAWAVADDAWRARWGACAGDGTAPADCARSIVQAFGLRLFRRPLTDDELERYTAIFELAQQQLPEFWPAFSYPLTAMVLSPNFTHVIEHGREVGDALALDDYELAARLSFLLWDTTPDDALLEAAAAGLGDAARYEAEIVRMLEDDARIDDGVRAFATDMFDLALVERARIDPERFPELDDAMLHSMRAAVAELAVAMRHDGREFLAILDAGFAFADPQLAGHYGQSIAGDQLTRVELGAAQPRVGLLTEPGMLTARSSYALTSPTRRGRFIATRLLCRDVPDPPPNVPTDLGEPPSGTTRREQVEQHLERPDCAGCHAAVDPLGFGLEQFDAIGRVQTQDNGVSIDASGQLDDVVFDDARSLARALLDHPELRPCFARQLARYALGVEIDHEPALAWIASAFEQAYRDRGGDLVATLADFARSDAFRFARGLRG
ncbi:MAG: DUF1588 domain-containing protein [Nannocystaceae bacterium]|nr:DUF1588 domain-containing protein [Nannocystaceae bacterium]